MQRIRRYAVLACAASIAVLPALLAGCAADEDAASARTAAPPRVREVAGVVLYPLPRPLVSECRRLGQRAATLLCPTALPRPSRALEHTASIPDAFHIFPIRGRSGPIGVSISYSAEARLPRLNQPERFIHFDVQRRSAADRLPPQAKPARLGRIEGLYSPPTSHEYASEPYFANHARFFWREAGVRYAATLHDFGPRTRPLLSALVRGLVPARRVPAKPRPRQREVRTFGVPLGPVSLASGAEGVWVAGLVGEASHLIRLDPAGRAMGEPLQISRYLAPVALAVDRDDIWIAQPGFHQPDLLRLDPAGTGFAPDFTKGMSLTDLALDDDDLWALDLGDPAGPQQSTGTLERLARASGRTSARIPVGEAPSAVAVGAGSVWVANSSDGSLSRVDPETDRVSATIDVDRAPVSVDVGAGAVWVANAGEGTLSRVDPATSQVAATIDVGRAPRAVVFALGSVWVANYLDDTVSRVDPGTNEVTETIAVGAGPYAVAGGHGAVWVGNRLDHSVSRIGR